MLKLKKMLASACLGGFVAIAAAGQSAAAVVYNNDFEAGDVTGFSGSYAVTGTQGYSADGFGQQFLRTGSGFALNLTGLAAHTSVNIGFLFAAIDSWDGVGAHGDALEVKLDGTSIVNFVVGIASGGTDAFPTGVSEIGSQSQRGFSATWADRAFDMNLGDFAHTGTDLELTFNFGGLAQGIVDESLAIDNLRISTNATVVPLPAGLPLLIGGLGVLGMAGRRRKKARRA